MEHPKFRSISLKAELIAEVENHIAKSGRYRSIADFVSEAVRLRLQELDRNAPVVGAGVEVEKAEEVPVG